ncbi:MAG: sulfatase-like hydrolase/transferase [Burkholderiales bacterium]|nr:sulfatase-like hydrolase/transferase [Burkholderiales bacterium]
MTRPSTGTAAGAPATRLLALLLEVAWIVLLVLPGATSGSASRAFDADENALFLVSCWLVVAARLLFPRRAFFLATLPAMLFGAVYMAVDFLRGADLLALLLQWRTFSAVDVGGAVRPYVWIALAGTGALAVFAWACWRVVPGRATDFRTRVAVFALTAGAAVAVPPTTWLRAWPVNGVLVLATTVSNSRVMAQYLFPDSSTVNPRNPAARWNATRVPGAPASETVVLVIGETIRDDFLRECGGPTHVRPVAPGALVACDVTAGADGTDMSVPLLVSRELPGHRVRASDDATVVHALQEAGFEGHWISAQALPIAWPDAEHTVFAGQLGADAALLLPPLRAVLARPAPLKAVVLHANNAHDPYCVRYDPARAPYPAACMDLGMEPSPANLTALRDNYANAVDASVGFVNDVVAALDGQPQPAFLIYSPDHAENLLDDGRVIWGHSRRHPTQWDTHVPAIFWANAAWRDTHAAQWARLQSQAHAPLMHADLVPTLLDAAGVRYDEPRTLPVDLLARPVPARTRIVQRMLDAVIPWQTLVDEARAAGPRPASATRSAR